MISSFLTERGFDEIFNKTKEKSQSSQLNKSEAGLESFKYSGHITETAHAADSSELVLGPQSEYVIQRNIRKYFAKPGINTSTIAAHPDFVNLPVTGGTINQYVSTLFIDIKGSTRLSLLYDLEFIYAFKNAVLQTCIEIVRSFDGYVHRLMGDAVMAFFGSKSMEKEQAAIDSINCSLMCKLMLETAIKPWLEKHKGFDAKNFGFRIGCNFGDDHEILWGNYGYGYLGEVSPTGLPVDLAAKLQGLANKNEIMIGQGVIDFIRWPEEFSSIKTTQQQGVDVPVKYITPNYLKKDGSKLNYSMRILDYKNCLEYLPIDSGIKSKIQGSRCIDNPLINFNCYVREADGTLREYTSASSFLEKKLSLVFTVEANNISRLKFPLNINFIKKNHGPDVPPGELEEEKKYRTINRSSSAPFSKCSIDEGTLYRGVHTMGCEVYDADNSLVYRNKIAVLIK